ncbi:hypothetical protein [Yersinia pestis]|uniref:hypothetical protein n=1 Tax=Yersinia pestis TaxID=632 RepID=UPI001E2D9F2B|nr:hypothetical protein [Yersinia pestis]MDL1014009.1 hypothetical protein [Yersinia pestis]
MDDKGYAVLSQQLFAGDRQRLKGLRATEYSAAGSSFNIGTLFNCLSIWPTT